MRDQEAEGCQSRLDMLRTRLSNWRETHGGRGRRIPEALWAEAAKVAREEGVEVTARCLRLNRDRLEERVAEGCRQDERCGIERSEFVEVALPQTLNSGRAMIMVANSHGDELCIAGMAGCVDIRTLLRDFWGRH